MDEPRPTEPEIDAIVSQMPTTLQPIANKALRRKIGLGINPLSAQFVITADSKELEANAYNLSSQCAAILNRWGAPLKELAAIRIQGSESPDTSTLADAAHTLLSFLTLFCAYDAVSGEYAALQPQTALRKLREIPPQLPQTRRDEDQAAIEAYQYYPYYTHSYPAFSMLDVIAKDCCSADANNIAMARECFPKEGAWKQVTQGLSFDYETFAEGFTQAIGKLTISAQEMLISLAPENQRNNYQTRSYT